MVFILLGALLFIGGVLFTAIQPMKGRLSQPRSVSPTPQGPQGKTLEPERPGRGLGIRSNWPGLAMMAIGAIILLMAAAGMTS